MIHNRIGVNNVTRHYKYLGLRVVFGRSKKGIFELVVERVWKKIKGWKEKFLSKAGKELLIKVVAQVIPEYVKNCYKILERVFHKLEVMLAKFDRYLIIGIVKFNGLVGK